MLTYSCCLQVGPEVLPELQTITRLKKKIVPLEEMADSVGWFYGIILHWGLSRPQTLFFILKSPGFHQSRAENSCTFFTAAMITKLQVLPGSFSVQLWMYIIQFWGKLHFLKHLLQFKLLPHEAIHKIKTKDILVDVLLAPTCDEMPSRASLTDL